MVTCLKLALQAFILLAALLSVSKGLKCKVAGKGLTWNFVPGRDDFSAGVQTEEECKEFCSARLQCKGYSWRPGYLNDGECYVFSELEGIHVCEDCYSGTVLTRFKGNCVTDSKNLIGSMSTSSEEDCQIACTNTDECMAYTWINESKNTCFLYNECSKVEYCDGCFGGSLNCFGPPQCFDYLTLDSEKRNENYPGADDCDSTQSLDGTSEDWQGAGYYRLLPPAGNGIATRSPGPNHCGTNGVLYISDDNNVLPNMESGDEAIIRVCNDAVGYPPCDWTFYITVTKCPEDFFVYQLPNLLAESCAHKFCSSLEP